MQRLNRRSALDLLFRSADDDSLYSERLWLYLNRHWQWIQAECLNALSAHTPTMRKGALFGLECLARQGKLQPETVIPVLKRLDAGEEPAATRVLNAIYDSFPAFRPSDWKEPTVFVPTDRGRDELQQMFESPDERTVCVALWDAANYEEDWRWVQAECLKRLKSSKELQYGALVGLNYLALRGDLEPDVVLSALQEIEDEWTAYIRENIYRFWKPQ